VLLPFLPGWWLAFGAVDVGVFVSVYGFFHGIVGMSVVGVVLPVLVVLRTVILIQVVATATRKRRVVASTPEPSTADAVLTVA
jgi:uncharacterized membrane protein